MSLFKLPKCKHFGGVGPYTGDSDFCCGYPRQDYEKYDDIIEGCTDCTCSWKEYAGRINPKTNLKIPFIICLLLYGLPLTRQPRCGRCKHAQKLLKDDGRFESTKCPMTDRYIDPDKWTGCHWFRGIWEKEQDFDWVAFENWLGKSGEGVNYGTQKQSASKR